MRVLLDECVPHQVIASLNRHDVRTVGTMGWAGKKNGELLRLSAARFDVFVTVDQNLSYQNDLRNLHIAVIVLVAPSNEIDALRPLLPRLKQVLRKIKAGQVIRVGR